MDGSSWRPGRSRQRTTTSLSLLAMVLASLASAHAERKGLIGATPHDSFSSSIGVLGCKINTNRVAYWPEPVDCDNVCVSLAYGGRQVHLLRVDQSGGAYDVSYDAWNYLVTGKSATEEPTAGGAVEMEFEYVEASRCGELIRTDDGRLPLSAANSINFLASCLGQPGSWVAGHYALYNILDSLCSLGYDERCSLDAPGANQPSCSHVLGQPEPLANAPVYNIRYPTGEKVLASTNQVVTGDDDSSGRPARRPWDAGAILLVTAMAWVSAA